MGRASLNSLAEIISISKRYLTLFEDYDLESIKAKSGGKYLYEFSAFYEDYKEWKVKEMTLFEKMTEIAIKHQDKWDKKENGGAGYVNHDLSQDKSILREYGYNKPFLWIVRKMGTHFCRLKTDNIDYLHGARTTWMYYADSPQIDAHYYFYDGINLKKISATKSIAMIEQQIRRIDKVA